MNHQDRKLRSDDKSSPEFYYSYVLRFEDTGDFYVGSTNNPAARFTEHAVGVGAVATSGRGFTVCLVHQFGSRREAEYNEDRIKHALAKGPVNVEAMIDNFNRISMMIRPEKTLSQLRDEEKAYESEMRSHVHLFLGNRFSNKPLWSACGWEVPFHFADGPVISAGSIRYDGEGYYEMDVFVQQAREEDALRAVGGDPRGRKVCRRCLALSTAEVR